MKYRQLLSPTLLTLLILSQSTCFVSTTKAQPAAVVAKAKIDVARGDLDGKRVVFLGDSTTANGTHLGYVETILRRKFPQQEFDFISMGLPSETASGLTEPDHPFPRPCVHERLERVLERSKPQVVIACYGMNDGIYHPDSEERTKAYHDAMDSLVEKCKKAGAQVVLLTPPAFDAKSAKGIVPIDAKLFGYKTPYEDYNEVLVGYGKWLLSRDDVITIDVNTPMTRWLDKKRKDEPDFRSGDGVHPAKIGYMALAMAILDGMGVEIADATPAAALENVENDSIYKSVESRRSKRSQGWMRHTGYIRGPKNQQPEPIGDTETQAEASRQAIRKMLSNSK